MSEVSFSKGRRASKPCPLCGKEKSIIFFEVHDIPCSCNMLWRTKEEALKCSKGDLTLAYCPVCAFIANYSLEPEKNQYVGEYDNSLYYSRLFQDFARNHVLHLIDRFDLHGKTIMEVTVGKVDFLSFFCNLGSNKGIRFDTSFINSEELSFNVNASVTGSSDKNFGWVEPVEGKLDFVFCFFELEHANSPRRFLNILKEKVGDSPETIFYFSVPNVERALHDGDFTNFIYEHPSYFTKSSLLFLFRICGFTVLDIIEEEQGAFCQSLSIVASLKKKALPQINNTNFSLESIEKAVKTFAIKTNSLIDKTVSNVRRLLDEGKRIVAWGAGARGVTVLNIIKDDRIRYVIDINPNKQGKFLPGTAQEISAPDFLVSYKPDYVFVMNSVYKDEIKRLLLDLKVKSEILTLVD